MKIMIVRHAEPDYSIDSLTEKGRVEAELLSRRLCREKDVLGYYVSPLGRARETARYTMEKLGSQAEVLPWLEEFRGTFFDPDRQHIYPQADFDFCTQLSIYPFVLRAEMQDGLYTSRKINIL